MGRKQRLRKGLQSLLAIVMLLTLCCVEAKAATVKTIPDSYLTANENMTQLMLNLGTFDSCEFHGVTGNVYTGTNGRKVLAVKAEDNTKAFTYTDFLDVYFKDIGEIGGRSLNLQIHFDSIFVDVPYARRSGGYPIVDEVPVLQIADSMVENRCITNTPGFDDGRWAYPAAETLRTSFVITWADTGETANIPFIHCVNDIDAYNSPRFIEWWEGTAGYVGTILKYESCIISITDMKASSNEATLAIGGTDGEDRYLKSGILAPTNNGEFTCDWGLGNCATEIQIYSPYTDIPEPEKTADASKTYNPGDMLEYTISQKKSTLYQNLFSHYTNMMFIDKLPEEVDYASAKLYDDGVEVTDSYGTLAYAEDPHTVTYTIKEDVLKTDDFYDGKELELVIQTQITGTGKLSNKAMISIDGVEYETDTCEVECVPKDAQIRIYKKIDPDNVIWAKGNPVFLFQIKGQDIHGVVRIYYRAIEFREGDPGTKSIEMTVPVGTYAVSELDTNDWKLDHVEALTNAKTDGEMAVLDANGKEVASCSFYNVISDYGNYTDTDLIYNPLIK